MHQRLVAFAATVLAALTLSATACVSTATGAAHDPERILIVGDSVTQGWKGDYTWRYFAWKQLEAERQSVDFVGSATGPYGAGDWNYTGDDAYADPDFDTQHAAVAGGVLQHEGHSLQQWPVAEEVTTYDADVVVSMWGINDLGNADNTVDDVIGYYGAWFARARAAKPSLDFVVAELPQTWLYDGKVAQFNDALRDLAGDLSTPDSTIVVAASTSLVVDDFIDGIHPTTEGERKIAAMMVDALAELAALDPTPTPTPTPTVEPTPATPATTPTTVPTPVGLASAPPTPRRVKAARSGARIVVSWRPVADARRYSARCGSKSRTTAGVSVAMRASSTRCKVRAVNVAGRSAWAVVRVRQGR